MHLWLQPQGAAGTALVGRGTEPRLRIALALLALATAVQMLWLVQGRTGWLAACGAVLYLMHARGGWRLVGGAALVAVLLAAATIGGLGGGQRLADPAGELPPHRERGQVTPRGERTEMWANSPLVLIHNRRCRPTSPG